MDLDKLKGYISKRKGYIQHVFLWLGLIQEDTILF